MSGINLIEVERNRQLKMGFDSEHDKAHGQKELASAAAALVLLYLQERYTSGVDNWWPKGWNLKDEANPALYLKQAGALIAAELDRIEADTPQYLEIRAGVRYWEDATVNGKEDVDGSLVPCRDGVLWCPTIVLDTGEILGWPSGTTASIHYKVCDSGEYYLLDSNRDRISRCNSWYVPSGIICPKKESFGDYIILEVDNEGCIVDWRKPDLSKEEWVQPDEEPNG